MNSAQDIQYNLVQTHGHSFSSGVFWRVDRPIPLVDYGPLCLRSGTVILSASVVFPVPVDVYGVTSIA